MKKSLNPFDEDEPGGLSSSSKPPNWQYAGTASPGRSELQCQISDSQSRTKASQQRALSSIYNSEQIGVAAAQELIEQGEKLNRAEQKLEEISELQKDSQKKINTLSSVFGGFKNIFSRRQSQPVPQSSSVIDKTLNNRNQSNLRQSIQCENSWGNQYTSTLQQKEPNNTSKSADAEFENNLALMGDGMSRLKSLAQGMHNELRNQNDQLDRMAPQIHRVTDTMSNQNRQINKLLGIRPK
ncbi:synaptosomal associated protein, putative [Schistosoma mansoni]|uniref:synaptosomal associated protein, putative n=1 Tax=Schistosoma mansoni TaxID=6183 RepID=UPI0001A64681|nr:synaptosomal associated protein, putative [Schistosoma mansoni]|eukprot:XP_018647100.1 synaptosomal associated protein, putative [Schistosoma mansoni]